MTDSVPRARGLLLGAAVRPLGAFPSGWRIDGAHHDPLAEPAALRRLAAEAERAHLHLLFFGDWLATGPELEFTDPYLLARVDPLSAVAYLAALTERIGLIATVSTSHSDPFAVARSASSIDQLSAGRLGLNLVAGSEPGAEANQRINGAGLGRHEVAEEYLEVLRGLWDSWDDEAVVADAAGGVLLDHTLIRTLDQTEGAFRVAGPALTPRPVQGQIPIVHADVSARARRFSATHADVHLVSPAGVEDGIRIVSEVRAAARDRGRDPADLAVLVPVLPIIAPTREEAWALYDRLVELVPVSGPGAPAGVPDDRTDTAIRRVVGVPMLVRGLDDVVSESDAGRFTAAGVRLLEIVRQRSGRVPGGHRPVTYRHLLIARLFTMPVIVGSPADVADHLATWFARGAADGFLVQSAFLHEQFEAFTRTVVPILVERGLFRAEYTATTLRGHLGLSRPERQQHPARDRSVAPRPSLNDRTPPVASAFDGVVGLFTN
ncbi:NtaA/DmoA family FMN-dependent monooxygenase [Herbiconiux sp.]|uniref:NtaA/DmoA family FMN-dependent monooxygenase n=1 Tax=Herbiconiux sp. TaxID=1871186 RepID=UPI0025B90E95|nr:NtaA/DmoA family FMN-dependent monooxygenase [Herbiconiux sp.]